MNKNLLQRTISYFVLIFVSIIVFFFSIEFGSSNVSFVRFIFFFDDSREIIVLRVLQSLAVFLSGWALSVSGFVLQRIMRNNLVDPGITGVLSGSALGITLFSFFNFNIPEVYSIVRIIFALIFGVFVGSILMFISMVYKDSLKVVIFGVIINSFLSGVIVLIQSLLDPYKLQQTFSFLMGGVVVANFEFIYFEYTIVTMVVIALILFSKKMDILSLGDIDAHVLGVSVRIWRSVFLILVVLLSSVSVSLSGIVSFLGFIVPNVVNFLYYKSSWVNTKDGILISGILGSIFLLLCHVLSKVLVPFYQLPLGVLTGIIGAPLFAFVILKLSSKY